MWQTGCSLSASCLPFLFLPLKRKSTANAAAVVGAEM